MSDIGRSLVWIIQKVICTVEIAVKYLALPNAQYVNGFIKVFKVSEYGSYEIYTDPVFRPILVRFESQTIVSSVHSKENFKVRRRKYVIIVTDLKRKRM